MKVHHMRVSLLSDMNCKMVLLPIYDSKMLQKEVYVVPLLHAKNLLYTLPEEYEDQ